MARGDASEKGLFEDGLDRAQRDGTKGQKFSAEIEERKRDEGSELRQQERKQHDLP